jgi:hypothetical protein
MTNSDIVGYICIVIIVVTAAVWSIYRNKESKPAVHHAHAAKSQALEWALREVLKEPGNATRNIALAENALNLFHHKKP